MGKARRQVVTVVSSSCVVIAANAAEPALRSFLRVPGIYYDTITTTSLTAEPSLHTRSAHHLYPRSGTGALTNEWAPLLTQSVHFIISLEFPEI